MNITGFHQHAAWLSAKPAAAALSPPSPSSPSQAWQAATALHQSHTSAEQKHPAGQGTEVPATVCAPTLSGCSLCDFSILQYRSRTEKQVKTISASGPDNRFLCFWVQADIGHFISVRKEGQSTATHSSPQNNRPCWQQRFWLEDAQGQAGLDFNWD